MKLEVVSHQVSFVGKVSEKEKIEKYLALLADDMNIKHPVYFDNSYESEDIIDLGFSYDQADYTVKEIREMWKAIKREL